MNKFFNKLNEHLGYGNPNSAIWFVGVEEAGVWTKSEFKKSKEEKLKIKIENYTDDNYFNDVDDTIKTKYEYVSEDKKYSYFGEWDSDEKNENYYNNISKICSKLNDFNDWLIFKHNYLCKKSQSESKFNTFITNLYPLGFKRIRNWDDYKEDYKKIFGLDEINSKKEFYKFVKSKTKRFENMNQLWLKSKPVATICTGMSLYKDFLECFGKLDTTLNWNHYQNSRNWFFKEKTFFVVNHLSYNSYYALFMKNNYNQLYTIIEQYKNPYK